MIKQLTLFFLILYCFSDCCVAQESHQTSTKNSFVEWNFGVAMLLDEGLFSGTSVLIWIKGNLEFWI